MDDPGNLTRKIKEGVGVNFLTFMNDRIAGMCPFRAPTKHILDDVIIWTESPPNAEMATVTGIIQEPTSKTLSPNVWEKEQKYFKNLTQFHVV